ncbi:MAG: HKD family nuclease [Candidatus Omnitrophota bacterium]|jgi:HKD family nuclease
MLKRIFLLLIAICFILPQTGYSNITDAEEIIYLPTKDYFEKTISEIHNAESSIDVYMYLTSISRFRTGSKPYQILMAIIDAHNRGVTTNVVLDENYDFVKTGTLTEKQFKRTKNIPAYELLKSHQVPVKFDSASVYTHAKVIVIDNKTVIMGSGNWSTTALTRNVESNILIRSSSLAKQVLDHLRTDVATQASNLISPLSVYLSWEFLNNPRLLGELITSSDHRAYETYLLILRFYDANEERKVIIDYKDFQQILGMDDMSIQDARRQINKVLTKLEEKYKLIDLTLKYGGDAEVILKDYEDPTKLYTIPTQKYISIPHKYWNYGWNNIMSFKASVNYLLNIGYASLSKTPPTWFYSLEDLSERHNASVWFLSNGTSELKKLNLVEVQYDDIKGVMNDEPRKANRYTPNALYDPERLEQHFKSIENEYGLEKLQRARELLTVVNEDSDANAAKALIELEDKYGLEVILKAKKILDVKKTDNPAKNIAYLIATIRGIGEKSEELGL